MKLGRARKIMIPLGIIGSVVMTHISCHFLLSSTLSLIEGIKLSLPILSLIGPMGIFVGAAVLGIIAYTFIHNLSKIKGKDELLGDIVDMKTHNVTYVREDNGVHIVSLDFIEGDSLKECYTLVSKSEKKIIVLNRYEKGESNEYSISEANNIKNPDLMGIEKIQSIFQVKEGEELKEAKMGFKEYNCNTKMSSVLAKEAVRQNTLFYGFFSS